jgi:glycosyltransferase involved in cell wall biosynthesis
VPYKHWRIGFLADVDRLTPDAVSGVPYAIYQALQTLVSDVRLVVPGQSSEALTPDPPGSMGMLPRVRRRLDRLLRHSDGTPRMLDSWATTWVHRRLIDQARREARAIERALENHRLDAIVSVMGSRILFALETSIPTLHFSDCTAALLSRTYSERSRRGAGCHRAWEEIERATLSRATVIALATDETRRSAIEDYGVDPSRIVVAPMGATVMPEPGRVLRAGPPTGTSLRLCIVAADPVRKRVAFALECVEQLAARGWDAELYSIGPPPPSIPALTHSPRLKHIGRLKLSDPADRAKHRQVLAESHLMILPSLAEAAGIAPAEAAHFGRPSIVSSAGGLPTMVKHQQTGLVMPMEATPEEYAREIDLLCRDPERYERMSHAALSRAHRELTWIGCARTMLQALVPVVGQPSLRLVRP